MQKSSGIICNIRSILITFALENTTNIQTLDMILTFRLVSDEVNNFKREIQIDATATFLDLKNAICDAVGYKKNQLSSFFICDRNWEKKKEITFEDMDTDADQDVWLMEDSELDDFVYDEGQRLLYVFDYMTDRAFFMELVTTEPGKNIKDPICSLSVGKAPEEFVEIDDFDPAPAKNTAAQMDVDEDFYGSDGYNEDEFDQEGFEEMPFEDN